MAVFCRNRRVSEGRAGTARRIARGTAGAALAAALGIAGQTAAFSSPAGAATTARVFASGVVTGVSGAPALGASVTLVAWPSAQYLAALQPGDPVPMSTLGSAVASSSGRYSVSATLAGLSGNYVEPDGHVNAEFDVDDNHGTQQSFSVSAALPGSAAAANTDLPPVVPGATTDSVSLDLSAGSVSETVGTGATTTVAAPTTVDAVGSTSTLSTDISLAADTSMEPDSGGPPPLPTSGCARNWTSGVLYPNRTEKFLNLYTYGSAEVDTEIGTSHKLGVGFTVTGGDWGADGTATIDSSASSGADASYKANFQLSNEVNYRHFYRKCWKAGSSKPYLEHEARPVAITFLQTGATHIVNRAWSQQYCHYYDPSAAGRRFTKYKGANQTFSAGVSLPFFTLSAEVVFSKSTTVTWTIPAAGEQLCGSTSDGFASAPFGGGQALPATGCGHPAAVDATDPTDTTAVGSPDC